MPSDPVLPEKAQAQVALENTIRAALQRAGVNGRQRDEAGADLREVVAAMLSQAEAAAYQRGRESQVPIDGTNHHNARACPYCTPGEEDEKTRTATDHLVALLIEEYGEDDETWRAMGSARRIARALLFAEAAAYDCGHTSRQSGCGGCDPSAIEFIRDDDGPWISVLPPGKGNQEVLDD